MKNFFKQKNRGPASRRQANASRGGFTLVETLVAISIFTMSILALMSALTAGIADANYAKEKIIASYLAQEGVEYIRNMRDTFVLYNPAGSQVGWVSFNNKVAPLGNTICAQSNGNGCYFGDLSAADFSNQTQPMAGLSITACNGTCPHLLYDTNTGKYDYATGVASTFIRKIQIIQVNVDEIKVFSTVYWTQGSGSYSVVFSEDLFNWVE